MLNLTNHKLNEYEGYNPHLHIKQFINNEDYETLLEQYPDDSLFKDEIPESRKHGQRPHCRRLMVVKTGKESPYFDPYIKSINDLPFVWQTLLAELKSKDYKEFMCDLLKIKDFRIRFDFHRTQSGLDVSPHVDSIGKYASHLLYFMPKGWKEEYGGSTIFYRGRKVNKMNPEPTDFEESKSYPTSGNTSLIFKNVPEGWHGITEVKTDNIDRQICNVLILKKDL